MSSDLNDSEEYLLKDSVLEKILFDIGLNTRSNRLAINTHPHSKELVVAIKLLSQEKLLISDNSKFTLFTSLLNHSTPMLLADTLVLLNKHGLISNNNKSVMIKEMHDNKELKTLLSLFQSLSQYDIFSPKVLNVAFSAFKKQEFPTLFTKSITQMLRLNLIDENNLETLINNPEFINISYIMNTLEKNQLLTSENKNDLFFKVVNNRHHTCTINILNLLRRKKMLTSDTLEIILKYDDLPSLDSVFTALKEQKKLNNDYATLILQSLLVSANPKKEYINIITTLNSIKDIKAQMDSFIEAALPEEQEALKSIKKEIINSFFTDTDKARKMFKHYFYREEEKKSTLEDNLKALFLFVLVLIALGVVLNIYDG